MGKLISSIKITADRFCVHGPVSADEEPHQFSNDLINTATLFLNPSIIIVT